MGHIGRAVTVVALVLVSGSASAHHSYAAYVTEQRVTIQGTLEGLRYSNPHVIMTIRTADSTLYPAIWQSALWVHRIGVTADTFRVGDFLMIYGAPARDASKHELASLRGVSRPSDGWSWFES
jgi:hypothetical protein